MKHIALLFFIGTLLASCGGSDVVEIGNKTTFEVNDVFDAGTVLKGELIKATFTIKNTGNYPLVIAEIKGSCTCTVVDKPSEPIAPGDKYVVKAEVDTDKTPSGAISKGVTIVANTEPSIHQVVIKAIVSTK